MDDEDYNDDGVVITQVEFTPDSAIVTLSNGDVEVLRDDDEEIDHDNVDDED